MGSGISGEPSAVSTRLRRGYPTLPLPLMKSRVYVQEMNSSIMMARHQKFAFCWRNVCEDSRLRPDNSKLNIMAAGWCGWVHSSPSALTERVPSATPSAPPHAPSRLADDKDPTAGKLPTVGSKLKCPVFVASEMSGLG